MIFVPACLMLALAWPVRPLTRWRRLPVAWPALFLAPALTLRLGG